MKIIILAAGIGSRLKGVGAPKALTLLSTGQSILEYQLEQIAAYAKLSEVIVVVGFKQERIRSAFPHLRYVENPDYEHQNTSKSLLKAIQHLDEEVLWLNGDVVFNQQVLEPVLGRRSTCMVVNTAVVGSEEVKYRTDGAGRILEVSKGVQEAEGEAVGINFFSQNDLHLLKRALDECAESDYFEKGIETCISQGCIVRAVPIAKTDCIEIDFLEDLEAANKLVGQWKQRPHF